MIVSPRLSKILQLCLEQDTDEFMSMDELSSLLKISKRTLFREIQDIAYVLEPFQLQMISKTGLGLQIVGEKENKEQLYQQLQSQKHSYLIKEDRRKLLILEILRANEVQKLYYYADVFQVSQATIRNDLDCIESWFENFNLQIHRTPGLGIELVGDELNYRKALTAILNESLASKHDTQVDMYNSQSLLNEVFTQDEGIFGLLNQEILTKVLAIFETHGEQLGLIQYAQSSYIGLMIHLVVAIDRIQKHEEIKENTYVVEMMVHDPSYQQAKKFKQIIDETFAIQMPEAEVAFIAMHMKAAKLTKRQVSEPNELLSYYSEEELLTLIDQMIMHLPKPYDVLLKDDDELLTGLIAHLRPTLIRLKHQMSIYNPLLDDVKKQYATIYEYARKAGRVLEKKYEYTLPEDEIAYIAMHIGAAIERSKRAKPMFKEIHVGIVCASGIGVSALLQAKLAKIVDSHVHLETLSMDQVHAQDYTCELLLTTMALPDTTKAILINPLLPPEDEIKVKDAISKTRMTTRYKSQTRKEGSPIDKLANTVLDVLESFSIEVVDYRSSKQDVMHVCATLVSDDVSKQQEVIKQLQKREEMNTTVFSDLGLALFHGQGSYVDRGLVKLIRPNHEAFIHEELSNIYFVLVMYLPENSSKEQMKMLSMLSRKLMEDDLFYQACMGESYANVYQKLEMILKEYVFEVISESRK
ncbi:transcriptional antiterminator [Breznakia blatticola]|uniref:Transcriptional antiterminator n=1 Tax=Breznakia blatticola TaxID=1754012 RepID=A0A4R7ZYK0_9FIRM|nr:BglG family transcription antiterminator [Breznakia blatticola]TDW20810.1 transcriptional antiterminator [Breznakia blatticola]